MGTWLGRPCGHVLDGTWRYRTPSRVEGEVRSPEASPDGQAQRGLAPTRGGVGPLGGSGPVEAIPEHPILVGTWGHQTYMSTGGGPETMIPAIRPGPYAPLPRGQG
jgi:hypothetical protein